MTTEHRSMGSEGLRAALKAVEFVHGICPACSGSEPDHQPDCLTAAALAAQPAAGEGLDVEALIPFVERPMTAAYFEDLKAGVLSSEQVARAIAGDLAALQPASEGERT